MKKTVFVSGVLGVVLFAGVCFGQGLRGREWNIYYDVMEENYTSSIPTGEGYFEKVKMKIAKKHGISVKELENIFHRGLDREPTRREWGISEYMYEQVFAFGDDLSSSDFPVIFRRTADKYEISLREVYEIYYRTMEWEMML